jgi:hypothetical protein
MSRRKEKKEFAQLFQIPLPTERSSRETRKMATQGGVIDLSSVIYDVDPVVLVPVGLLVIVLTASLPNSRRLSLRDSLVAFWYLFNGIIIHIFLDGCVLCCGRVCALDLGLLSILVIHSADRLSDWSGLRDASPSCTRSTARWTSTPPDSIAGE